jgi:hypothetical protein
MQPFSCIVDGQRFQQVRFCSSLWYFNFLTQYVQGDTVLAAADADAPFIGLICEQPPNTKDGGMCVASSSLLKDIIDNFKVGNEVRADGSFGQRNERDRGHVVLAVRTQWRITLHCPPSRKLTVCTRQFG